MKRQLLIPTSWSDERLEGICTSISRQTLLPQEVTFLIHFRWNKEELLNICQKIDNFLTKIIHNIDLRYIHSRNSEYIAWWWVWADRQTLVDAMIYDHCFMIDDDNEFDDDFFEKCITEYSFLLSNNCKNILYSPQIMYRKTWRIQSDGIVWYRRWFPKMIFASQKKSIHNDSKDVIMIGANSLLSSREVFQNIWFDSFYTHMMEDVDFSYRVYMSGVPIVVSDHIGIYHMEREKTFLQTKFISSWSQVIGRLLATIHFVRKNGTTRQQVQFFCCGLWCMIWGFMIWSIVGIWKK